MKNKEWINGYKEAMNEILDYVKLTPNAKCEIVIDYIESQLE